MPERAWKATCVSSCQQNCLIKAAAGPPFLGVSQQGAQFGWVLLTPLGRALM